MPALRTTSFLPVFFLAVSWCIAQSREPDDSWLMRNYHFTGPPAAPAPDEIQPVNPVAVQLQEVQDMLLSIMRKADFAWDFDTVMAAAAEVAANARLLGAVTGQLRPPGPPPVPPPAAPRQPPQPDPARYLIAFEDRTVEPATAVWTDRLMLHYLTPAGAHVQVRLDRVDWKRSAALNQPGQAWPPPASPPAGQ